jgi:hypothetical protein
MQAENATELTSAEAVRMVAEDRQVRISKAAEEIEAILKRYKVKLVATVEPVVTSDGTLKLVAQMRFVWE